MMRCDYFSMTAGREAMGNEKRQAVQGKSIYTSIIIRLIVFVLLPVIGLLFYSCYSLSREIRDGFAENYTTIVRGMDRNLDIYFSELKEEALELFSSEVLQEILEDDPELKHITRDAIRFREAAAGIYQYRTDIMSIKIYGIDSNNCISVGSGSIPDEYPTDQEIIQRLKEGDGRFTFLGVRRSRSQSTASKVSIAVGRVLKNLKTGEPIGYLLEDIGYRSFIGVCGQPETTKNGCILIIDEEDIVLYNSGSHSDILKDFTETEAYRRSWYQKEDDPLLVSSSYFPWRYVVLPDNTLILDRMSLMTKLYIVSALLVALLLSLFSVSLARGISDPLRRLEEAMGRARENNYNEIVPATDSFREVNQLIMHYNLLQSAVQDHISREKELMRQQQEAEFKALQMQITPHFLYNSLDSINCMAQIRGDQEISQMILSLGRIFQYNMRYDNDTVTLGEEIRHVRNYLTLQAVNYQNRFQIRFSIPEELEKRPVIKFMLQPLAENALDHGVKSMKSGGVISILAHEEEGFLCVVIKDNGKGMPKDQMEHLQGILDKPSPELLKYDKQEEGIGIMNVNLRLKLQFGESSGIEFSSKENLGTTVTVRILLSQNKV